MYLFDANVLQKWINHYSTMDLFGPYQNFRIHPKHELSTCLLVNIPINSEELVMDLFDELKHHKEQQILKWRNPFENYVNEWHHHILRICIELSVESKLTFRLPAIEDYAFLVIKHGQVNLQKTAFGVYTGIFAMVHEMENWEMFQQLYISEYGAGFGLTVETIENHWTHTDEEVQKAKRKMKRAVKELQLFSKPLLEPMFARSDYYATYDKWNIIT